jgi:MFS family permease
MYYVVYIMEAAGIGDALLAASIQYILNVALTLPAILFLDRWGRRPSLLIGSFGMMVILFIVGALEAAYGHLSYANSGPLAAINWVLGDYPDVSRAIVALSYLFVCTFSVTWGPTSWTYASEIFPTQVRAKAVSLATASNWLWNCALAFAVPPLLWSINWQMYMLFAAVNGAAFVHMFIAAPETMGKSLEEMNEVFDSGRPAWKGVPKGSRLDALQKEIAEGNLKVIFFISFFYPF